MRVLFACVLAAVFITCCKEESVIVDPATVEGKYVAKIDHYTVSFEDGATYDMNEKETKKIYYLVRHAEKDTVPKGNPQLSKEGEARAIKLAEIFKGTQLDALYSTMTTRTLFTVDTLADQKGLVTFPYEAQNFKELAEKLETSLDIHKSMIVGHSNTTPVLANHLYGQQAFTQTFKEDQYDDLVVVIENNDGKKRILKIKYK